MLDTGVAEWALAAAAAAGLAFLAPSLARLPRRLAVLRACAALLLLAAVLKPVVQSVEDRFDRPGLAVVIDQGPSMHASDDADRTRLRRAVGWLAAHRKAIEDRADPILYSAAAGARRLSWDALDELATAPGALDPASVFDATAGGSPPPSRVWLLSDGAFELSPEAGAAVEKLGIPIDTLGVGPREAQRGLKVSALDAPEFVFIHNRFPVAATVEAHRAQGRTVTLRLRSGARILGSKTFRAARPFEVFRTTFTIEADILGRRDFSVEASADGPDAAGLRAVRSAGVEVIRQKYRIMYLSGRPSFEYSHLRAQLKADPNHELVSFVILRNPEDFSPVPDSELSLIPFPADEIFVKSLFQFDLFILENFAFWRFQLPVRYLENLKRFVQQGGALLVLGGSNAFTKGGYRGTPLEETLPVTLVAQSEDFVAGVFQPAVAAPGHPFLQLGDTPEATDALWKALPPLDGYTRFAKVRPGSTVLLAHPHETTASGQRLPIVAVRPFGRGKVMMVGTDSTWRWKLGGGRDWKVSSFYARFWSRAVQYLTGSLELPKVKFSPLPDRLPPREPAILSLHVFDEHFRAVSGTDVDLRLLWTDPKGRRKTPPFFESEPGVFQVELTGLSEGAHKVRAIVRYKGQHWGEDTVEFRWEPVSGDIPLDRRRLQGLASLTGGAYADLRTVDPSELLDRLPAVRKERTVRARHALWSWPAWLWVLAALLLAEWVLRRRAGFL